MGLLSVHLFPIYSVQILEVALTQVQDLALDLVELRSICSGSLLKPVKVPMDGISSLKHTKGITWFGVI